MNVFFCQNLPKNTFVQINQANDALHQNVSNKITKIEWTCVFQHNQYKKEKSRQNKNKNKQEAKQKATEKASESTAQKQSKT